MTVSARVAVRVLLGSTLAIEASALPQHRASLAQSMHDDIHDGNITRPDPKLTVKRALGPGPIRKMAWKVLANKLLRNGRIVLHTDSAKSYKLQVDGVIHDRVVHCHKRVQVNGTFRWQKLNYVKLVTYKIPHSERTITVKSGTQIVDRAWRFLKDRISLNQNCRAGSKALRAKLRSAQYEYWRKYDDLWLHCGVLCSQNIKKLLGVQPAFPSGNGNTCGLAVAQVWGVRFRACACVTNKATTAKITCAAAVHAHGCCISFAFSPTSAHINKFRQGNM